MHYEYRVQRLFALIGFLNIDRERAMLVEEWGTLLESVAHRRMKERAKKGVAKGREVKIPDRNPIHSWTTKTDCISWV